MQRRNKGFTLIELVVVMVIIGILSVIAVPMYQGYVRRAMASEGRALVGGVATAERVYFAEHQTYIAVAETSSDSDLAIDCTQNTYFRSFSVAGGAAGITTSFVVTANGSGDANGIAVTLTQNSGAAPVVATSGI